MEVFRGAYHRCQVPQIRQQHIQHRQTPIRRRTHHLSQERTNELRLARIRKLMILLLPRNEHTDMLIRQRSPWLRDVQLLRLMLER